MDLAHCHPSAFIHLPLPNCHLSTTMFASRLAARTASRYTAQLRLPAQRRLASSSAENEFIRERQNIKEHAKGSTGQSLPKDTQ